MENRIAILDADKKHCQELCAILGKKNYRPIPTHSLSNLESNIKNQSCEVALIDIDTFFVDSRTIRNLSKNIPGVHILCLSKKRFHPELREALCWHIYACLRKPVDPDELFYLLRSIFKNNIIE